MLSLAELKPGQALVGLEPNLVATVVAVVPIAAGTVQVIYKTPDGTLKDRLLNSADEAGIGLATTERPWAFDGDGAAFQLTCEARRIDLAFLFDPMMAVHTSNVEPLPHQITAVYESILPGNPSVSSSPTTPALARPSWPGFTSASCFCGPTPAGS